MTLSPISIHNAGTFKLESTVNQRLIIQSNMYINSSSRPIHRSVLRLLPIIFVTRLCQCLRRPRDLSEFCLTIILNFFTDIRNTVWCPKLPIISLKVNKKLHFPSQEWNGYQVDNWRVQQLHQKLQDTTPEKVTPLVQKSDYQNSPPRWVNLQWSSSTW